MPFRIVISHRQTRFIDRFVQTFGSDFLVVFDDMTADDLDVVNRHNIPYLQNPKMGSRTQNRNMGLYEWESKVNLADNDLIEFFDGDRPPVSYDLSAAPTDFDVLLYTCENDKRLQKLKSGLVNVNLLCNPFYSCGFCIKYGLVKKIYQMNDGMLFDESFTSWGCEDQYLGVMCGSLGAKVYLYDNVVLNGQVGGDELSHPDYVKSLQHYIDKLREKNIFPHAK